MEHGNWATFCLDLEIDSDGITSDYSYHLSAECALDVIIWLINRLDLIPKYMLALKSKHYKDADDLLQSLTCGWEDMRLIYDAQACKDEFITRVRARVRLIDDAVIDPSLIKISKYQRKLAAHLAHNFKQVG